MTPYLLASLGDAVYGVYALSSLFAGWCGLLDFGLTTTTSRYITRYFTQGDDCAVNETGSTAIVLFGGISAFIFLLACASWGVALLFGDRFDETGLLGGALFFSGASFAVSKISDGVCGVIKGALHQELTGGTVFLFRILYGVLNFTILWFGGRLFALLIGNFCLTFLQLVVYIFLCRRAVPKFQFAFRNFRKKRVHSLFSYSFFTFLAQAGEIAVNRSDLVIIAVLLSMEDVARYNLVVVTLVSYFNSFLCETSSWQTNWFARFSALEGSSEQGGCFVKGEKSDVSHGANEYKRFSDAFYESRDRILRVSVYASIFMAFGLIFWGRAFITRWVGIDYLDAFPALVVYTIAIGCYRGSAETNTRLLQGLARHQILGIAALLHGFLNIILSVILLKMGFGLIGVAFGSVFPGLLIYYCWIPNVVCRLVGESRVLYWIRQIKTTLIAILSLIIPYFLTIFFVEPSYVNIFILAVLSAVLYSVTLYWFGCDRKERALFNSFAIRCLRRE